MHAASIHVDQIQYDGCSGWGGASRWPSQVLRRSQVPRRSQVLGLDLLLGPPRCVAAPVSSARLIVMLFCGHQSNLVFLYVSARVVLIYHACSVSFYISSQAAW